MLFVFRFSENIVIDPGSIEVFPVSRIPKHMHHLLKPIYHRDKQKEKGFHITTDPATLSSLLKWVPDSEVSFLIITFFLVYFLLFHIIQIFSYF